MPVLPGPFPVWYPEPGAPLVPFEGNFLQLANSIANLLSSAQMPISVANQAERDALFPSGSRTQGNAVFRRDLGYGEVYFNSYSASNPGGMPSAGWRRADARYFQSGRVAQSTDANGDIIVTHGFPVQPGVIQVTGEASGPIAGRLIYTWYNITNTTFTIRVTRQDTGAPFVNNPVTFAWSASL